MLADRLTGPERDALELVLLTTGIIGSLALAVGWRDRVAAIGLLALGLSALAIIDGAPLVLPRSDLLVACLLLGLHAATPPSPFGSWTARERPDPAGDWRLPDSIPHVAWALLAIVYLAMDVERLSGLAFGAAEVERIVSARSMAAVGFVFDLGFVVGVFRVQTRASAWIAMSLWRIAWLFAFGATANETNLWLLHLLACDPAWLPGVARVSSARQARLFYDGTCGFCHRTVRILLAEEIFLPDALRLRFAPIESNAYAQMLARTPDLRAGDLPDSIVLELEDGRVLIRSAAAIEIANRLGGFWRALAFVLSLGGAMPRGVLDAAYDVVAKYRKRFFANPKESCPILPPHLRSRFEL